MVPSKRDVRKFIKDPVVAYVTLDDTELRVVESQYFQRLRYIKQNSTAYLTYPVLCGVTRFDHSLGVMEMAERILVEGLNNPVSEDDKSAFLEECKREFNINGDNWQEEVENRLRKIVRLAGLCHDLGHFPFSHTTEKVLEKLVKDESRRNYNKLIKLFTVNRNDYEENHLYEFVNLNIAKKESKKSMIGLHEFMSVKVVDELTLDSDPEQDSLLKDYVKKTLLAPEDSVVFRALNNIITSDIDADKIDYILRDGQASGSDIGRFDVNRLMASFKLYKEPGRGAGELANYKFLPSEQALSSIENMLTERVKLYRWVYYHHHVVLTDYLLAKLVEFLINIYLDSEELPDELADVIKLAEDFASRTRYTSYIKLGDYFDDIFLFSLLRTLYTRLLMTTKTGALDLSEGEIERKLEIKVILRCLSGLLERCKVAIPLWKKPGTFTEQDNQFVGLLMGDPGLESMAKDLLREGKKAINEIVEKLLEKELVESFEEEISKAISEAAGKDCRLFLVTKNFTPYHIAEGVSGKETEILIKKDEGWRQWRLSSVSQIVTGLNSGWNGSPHCFAYVLCVDDTVLSKSTMKEVRGKIFPQMLFKYAQKI